MPDCQKAIIVAVPLAVLMHALETIYTVGLTPVVDFYDVTFLLRAAKRSLIYGACSYVRKVEAKSIWLITAFHRCLIHVLYELCRKTNSYGKACSITSVEVQGRSSVEEN